MKKLKNIQANILRGHHRKNTRCIFLKFTGDSDTIKKWHTRLSKVVSTAWHQQIEYLEYVETKKKAVSPVVCFYLSKNGYEKMGFKRGYTLLPNEEAFWKGMEARGGILNDPPKNKWERQYQQSFDAMILVATNRSVEKVEDEVLKELLDDQVVKALFREDSTTLKNDKNEKVEHFGFRDGIRTPTFWKGSEPLLSNWKTVLVESSSGSYLVCRKLEQNVAAFKKQIKKIARSEKLPESYTESRILGRFKNGCLISNLRDSSTFKKSKDLHTDFKNDKEGLSCPFHAHVRKVSYREDREEIQRQKMVRRGFTYGARDKDLTDEPTKGVGMIFLAYQSSISWYFEHIQEKWINNPNYPYTGTGIDPIAGQLPLKEKAKTNLDKLSKVVTLKGGAYFFAPSIDFIKKPSSGKKIGPPDGPYPRSRNSNYSSFQFISNLSNSGGY